MDLPRIAVVGSLHYDIIVEAPRQPEQGETLIANSWSPKFGGKGGNQAVAAARAGAAVSMISAVGSDEFGMFLRKRLQVSGVDDRHVFELEKAGSGMSVAITDDSGDYAAVVISGANRCLTADNVVRSLNSTNLEFLILQNEIPEVTNHAAAEFARKISAKIIWNAAPTRDDSVGLTSLVNVLVVNSVEARQMTGIEVNRLKDAVVAAKALRDVGVPIAIVTAGAEGVAVAVADKNDLAIPGIPMKQPRTHGAGDVFVGQLAAAISKGAVLRDAVETANRRAAEHVSNFSVL